MTISRPQRPAKACHATHNEGKNEKTHSMSNGNQRIPRCAATGGRRPPPQRGLWSRSACGVPEYSLEPLRAPAQPPHDPVAASRRGGEEHAQPCRFFGEDPPSHARSSDVPTEKTLRTVLVELPCDAPPRSQRPAHEASPARSPCHPKKPRSPR